MSQPYQSQTKCVEVNFNKYERLIVHYANTFLNNIEAARDIAYESFTALMKVDCCKIEHPKGWLKRVTKNRALNYMDKRGNRSGPSLEDLPEEIDDPRLEPDRVTEFNDDAKKLKRYIDKLPDEQKEIIHCIYTYQMTTEEIKQSTGKTANNIYVLRKQGVQNLRKYLNEDQL